MVYDKTRELTGQRFCHYVNCIEVGVSFFKTRNNLSSSIFKNILSEIIMMVNLVRLVIDFVVLKNYKCLKYEH